MRKLKTRILSFLLIFSLCFQSLMPVYASTNETTITQKIDNENNDNTTVTPTPTITTEVTPTDDVTPTPTISETITNTPNNLVPNTFSTGEDTTPTPSIEPIDESVSNDMVSVTPTPTIELEVTPTPTGTITPTEEVTPTPTTTVIPTPTPTETVTPTPTIEITPTPTEMVKEKVIETIYFDGNAFSNGGELALYTLNYKDKATMVDYLPETIDVKFENERRTKTINVDWTTIVDPMSYDGLNYKYYMEIPNEYKHNFDDNLPYVSFNINYHITKVENYNIESSYKEFTIHYQDVTNIDSILPSTLEVTIEGKDDIQEIPISWTCNDDITKLKSYYYKYTGNLSSEYILVDIPMPYIDVNIKKTITGTQKLNSSSQWNEQSTFYSYETQYNTKEEFMNSLPSTLKFYINETTTNSIKVKWVCDEDFVATNKKAYTFYAFIDSSVSGYDVPDDFTNPFVNVKIKDTITNFVGLATTTTAYTTFRIDKSEKNTISTLFPSYLIVNFNEDMTKEIEIPVTWVCEKDPLTTNEDSYLYYAKVGDEYSVSPMLALYMPFIEIKIVDSSTFSNKNETYTYTGTTQKFVAPVTGKYKLTAYGASGGGNGGLGGYAEGYVLLEKGDALYIQVGGMGSQTSGGYNGGGDTLIGSNGGYGGGGATSITTTNRGLLSEYQAYINEILLVAGGGGGGPKNGNVDDGGTGNGGGSAGGGSYDASWDYGEIGTAQTGGTQVSGYKFGQGQEANSNGNGAGGGGYYGGKQGPSNRTSLRGGGGSGYYNNVLLTQGDTISAKSSGNGKVSISYAGIATSTLVIKTNNGGYWEGQEGTIFIEQSSGTVIDVPNPTPKSGYTFAGWVVEVGNGRVLDKKYTFTNTNTTIRAIWKAPLTLESEWQSDNTLDLIFSQEDEYSKSFRVYESKDKTNWYLAQSNNIELVQEKIWDYSATGGVQTFIAPYDGYYKLEAWGAQGGGTYGGLGAYVKGTVYLNAGQTLYVYVGKQATNGAGGWNGGGTNQGSSYGGGGATDFSLSNGAWNSTSHLYSRILVAAGGGGYNALGGNAGGGGGYWNGLSGSGDDYGSGAAINRGGDTSSDDMGAISNGSFGVGGSASWCGEYLGGGGGGWYGGGAGGGHDNNGSGGGGSSYAWTASLASYYPNSSYKPSTAFYLKDVSGAQASRVGNGYARITFNDALLDESISRFDDVVLLDENKPNTIGEVYEIPIDATNSILEWSIPSDNGTTYYHRVNSYLNTDKTTVFQTSNIVSSYYVSGIAGYYYYIDGSATGTVTNTHTFINTNTMQIEKPTSKKYIHIAAVDKAGNIGPTANYEIKVIIYKVEYNSNTYEDTGVANTVVEDGRELFYGLKYNFKNNPFTKTGNGYYGQKLNYNFVGWGFKAYSSFAKTNSIYPYLYKTNMTTKLTNFMTTSPSYVPSSVLSNPMERLYYYNNDIFNNLTNKDETTITLYAEWVADNQRPYGGFYFKTFEYNDDGTNSKRLKNVSHDSYNVASYTDISRTITLYNDNVYFINTQYRDPEGNACTVEYQYSIDGGTTWYKLQNSIPTSHQTHLNATNYSTQSGTLLGITFIEDTTVLIRMRARDTVTYPLGYTYNTTTKTYETFQLQKSMWSTGYFVDNSHNDYDANGKYLGDYGVKGNQGGSWYTKTINCVVGNQKPTSNLVADNLDVSNLSGTYTFEKVMEEVEKQNFFNFPMYDYTSNNETFNYKNGTLYFLLSDSLANSFAGDDKLNVFYNVNSSIFNYIKNTNKVMIKEDNYQYTYFTPEDESVAFLNASTDKDGAVVGNSGFSHYWIAICEKGTTKNVFVTTNDQETSYVGCDTSNGTLYTKTINGTKIQGIIYDSYEQMVKDIYDRSGALFATHGDNEINLYDVYFSVCDKSWNDISPNKWGNVTRKTLITEPRLSFYDVQFMDKNSTISQYEEYYSLYKNGSLPYYHISGYTLLGNKYKNYDVDFENDLNEVVTLKTLDQNAKQNYVINSNNFVSANGSVPIRLGYNLDFIITTHGNEKTSLRVYNSENELVEIIQPTKDTNDFKNNVLSRNEQRKGENGWYHSSNFSFAIPEQDTSYGYYINITIEKTPYTNSSKKITRSINIGDENGFLFISDKSNLKDIGIHIVD